jgi:hypothetical protein
MAGICTNEGRALISTWLFSGTSDRGANLEIGLILNTSVGVTSVLADIIQPTGGGYATKVIAPSAWTISNNGTTYNLTSEILFTPVGGPFVGDVAGYFIKSTGTTPRLLFAEVVQGVPYQVIEGDVYGIRVKIDLVGA